MRANLFISLAMALFVALPSVAETPPLPGTFVKLGASSGVDILINGAGREDWGSGAGFLDYDNDGDLDLFLTSAKDQDNFLLQQNNSVFSDVTVAAGLSDLLNGRAVKFADYDNDGDVDIFAANMRGSQGANDGPNRLWRNDGDGTFTDVAALASPALPSPNAPTFGAAWGDYDNDGWLDLYVVNRREVSNQFFHSNGPDANGFVTFTERAVELGLDDPKAGLEAVWLDYDNDGHLDLYLSNDKWGGNRLWKNDGAGGFEDVSIASRTNVTINSMGVAVGDYDNNGYLDIYLTNTSEHPIIKNVLLRNNGDGRTFDNVAQEAGVLCNRYGWGTAFLDYDNDGDLDLYVVNWSASGGDNGAKNIFYRNNGDGTFTDVSDAVGAGDTSPGYGLAVGDYNDDGFVDMFVLNNITKSIFYENVPTNNNWLKVRTIGTKSNRDGIGARIVAVTAAGTQIREVGGGSSYLCHNSVEEEFGFGNVSMVGELTVLWPSGTVDRLTDVPTNQTLTVEEGSTDPPPPPPPPAVEAFVLEQNYPNPFNPSTTIAFTLPNASFVKLRIFDARGALVARPFTGDLPVGDHTVEWTGLDIHGQSVAAGVYFYRLATQSNTSVRKMVMLK